jgi:DNA (cytosine-5)-methyltransferase 1
MSNMDAVRGRKLDRLRSGQQLRALELCSGCGGMSLGLETAGFELTAHLESDALAATTYGLNFAPRSSVPRSAWSKPREMVSCSPQALVAELGLRRSVAEEFDVLAAGLPCQAFARIGRSKLRSISGDDHAFKKDPRAVLYRRFLDYVRITQPLAILMENVPDILNFGGHNVPEEISANLDALGYQASYTLLNAAFYGVPQLRERLFLIAVDRSLSTPPGFPEPTHEVDLPRGYKDTRTAALKYVPAEASHFHPIPEPATGLPDAVCTRAALSDLPFISEHFSDPLTMRKRRLEDRLVYRYNAEPSDYARKMREWAGFKTHGALDGHVVRLTPRDFPIFQRLPRGDEYPKARQIAERLFMEKLDNLASAGCEIHPDSAYYAKLQREIIPPYDPEKFPNKWWKLEPTAPSRTLTAHIGKDSYSHIHYDGRQKRTISVREAARLQSFPDGFRFAGTMNSAFRQIGNAVPPLVAFAVARTLKQILLKAAAMVPDHSHLEAA